MSIPSARDRQQLALEWRNLAYGLDIEQPESRCLNRVYKEKEILKSISGRARPGEVLAILGASGAGKTTFLDALAMRKRSSANSRLGGELLVNGAKFDLHTYKQLVAYVPQEDVVMESLTPTETLLFAARMKLPRDMPDEEKRQRVDKLIVELGLQHCKDTIIGGTLVRGLSGGERKRVSIGVELVTDPSIILLDEPTSGLDSFTALSVTELLRTLARSGRTIVCTIHQPSSAIFALFDRVMMMVEGQCIFIGKVTESIDFFAKCGRPCPTLSNPADHFMRIMQKELRQDPAALAAFVNANAVRMQERSLRKQESDKGGSLRPEGGSSAAEASVSARGQPNGAGLQAPDEDEKGRLSGSREERPPLEKQADRRIGFIAAIYYLSGRAMSHILRQPLLTRTRFIQTVFNALFGGLLYLQLGHDQKSIQDRFGKALRRLRLRMERACALTLLSHGDSTPLGALFFAALSVVLNGVSSVVLTFPAERLLYFREAASDLYGPGEWLISKALMDLPFQIFFPLLLSAIFYFLVGFQETAEKFFAFYACLVLLSVLGTSMGVFMGCIVPKAEAAVALIPVFVIPQMLFSNFLNASPPIWLTWFKHISAYYYGFQILAINEFKDLSLKCNEEELARFNNTCFIVKGSQVIANANMDEDNFKPFFGAIIALAVGFRFIAFLSLRAYTKRLTSR